MGALISLAVLGYIIYKVIRFFDNYKKYKEIAENMSNNVEVPKEEIPQYDYSSKVNETYKVKQSEPEKKADKIITTPQEDYENHDFQYNDEKSFDDNVDDYYMEYGGVDDYDGSAPWGSASSSHSNYCYEDYSITGPDFKFHNRLDNYTKEELIDYVKEHIFIKDKLDDESREIIINWYREECKAIYKDYSLSYRYLNNTGFTFDDLSSAFCEDISILTEYGISALDTIKNKIQDKIIEDVIIKYPTNLPVLDNNSIANLVQSLYNIAISIYKISIYNTAKSHDKWNFKTLNEIIYLDPQIFDISKRRIYINQRYDRDEEYYNGKYGFYDLSVYLSEDECLQFTSTGLTELFMLWNKRKPNKFIEYMVVPLAKTIIYEIEDFRSKVNEYTEPSRATTKIEIEENRLCELFNANSEWRSMWSSIYIKKYLYPQFAYYFIYIFNNAMGYEYNNDYYRLYLDIFDGWGNYNIRTKEFVVRTGQYYSIFMNIEDILSHSNDKYDEITECDMDAYEDEDEYY